MRKFLKITGKIFLGIISIIIVFVIVMFIITNNDYSLPKTVEYDQSLPHIEIDSVIFHSETFGSDTNEVVIIVHGGPGNDYRYLLPLKQLSKEYFVVFYDQRGSGLSPRVNVKEHSLENSLNDLANVIDYYAPDKKINIIGHSWGGMLASGYIAKHPDRVNKAVLAEPGMLTSEMAEKFMAQYHIKLNWSYIKTMFLTIFESFHIETLDNQERIDYIFPKMATLNEEGNPMRKYYCEENIENSSFPTWRSSGIASQEIMKKLLNEKGNIEIDLVSGLGNFSNKVLFIVGECNQIVGEKFQREQMKYFPKSEMKIIKDAGHTMFGEKTAESIELMEQFFKE
jgi:proline iminopeptidase